MDNGEWPTISLLQIRQYFVSRYPENTKLHSMFLQATDQFLKTSKIAWDDLGVTDLATQLEYEEEIKNIIGKLKKKV